MVGRAAGGVNGARGYRIVGWRVLVAVPAIVRHLVQRPGQSAQAQLVRTLDMAG